MRHPLVYIFSAINSCSDPLAHTDWKNKLKEVLSNNYTVFDPSAAFTVSFPGQEVVTINEFVLDHADILVGVLVPGSVGCVREVERAINQRKPVIAIIPPSVICNSPYFHDERIIRVINVAEAINKVIARLSP